LVGACFKWRPLLFSFANKWVAEPLDNSWGGCCCCCCCLEVERDARGYALEEVEVVGVEVLVSMGE
jgi:hypothetical protein